MAKRRLVSRLLLSVAVVGQLGWISPVIAMQDDSLPKSQTVAAESPSPVPSPPLSSLSPSPTPLPSPAASSPRPVSSAPGPEGPMKVTDMTKLDVMGCRGAIPDWVFDTVAESWVVADKSSFSCDKQQGYYLSSKYFYDTLSSWYKIIPPALAGLQPDSMITAPKAAGSSLSEKKSVGESSSLPVGPLEQPIPTSQATANPVNQSWVDLTNVVNIITTLQSKAVSGNVTADSNTRIGDVTSGAATALANIINLLASAWSWSNGDLNFFIENFHDYNKDIILEPATRNNGLSNSENVTAAPGTITDDKASAPIFNIEESGHIVNDIDVSVQSGDVTAARNTRAGDVTSGNALAQVNIINLIDSFISSGSSFFGIVNLFGTVSADILFPKGFLNGLIPSEGNTDGLSAGSVTAEISHTSRVENNITTTAESGASAATANTIVGDVSSGTAHTKQSLFNISGSNVSGDNAVLVIVNVLGRWMGQLMNLPIGSASSALLTGNVQKSANGTGVGIPSQKNTTNITNNVSVKAKSGDAIAEENTSVGSVTTGKAEAVSNVANIFNSVLNLQKWFGVLVINVFGDWTGDVNNDTAAGNLAGVQPALPDMTPHSGQVKASQTRSAGLNVIPTTKKNNENSVQTSSSSVSDAKVQPQVLTAAANTEKTLDGQVAAVAKWADMSLVFLLSALGLLVAGALISIDKKLNRRA